MVEVEPQNVQIRYRDPDLGIWLRERREEVALSADEVARAAWDYLAVPLRRDTLCALENGARHPNAYHLDALITLLGLTAAQRRWLIQRWAKHPRWLGSGVRPATWASAVAAEDRPIPKARRSPAGHPGSARLRSSEEVELTGVIRLHLTEEDALLLERAASMARMTCSDLVRQILTDTIESGKLPKLEPPTAPRHIARNIRTRFTLDQIEKWRKMSAGHHLNVWAYLVVFARLRSEEPLPVATSA